MTRAPALSERRDRRDRRADARVVGDLAVGERDVEVDADEDAFAGDVRVADRELVHRSRRQSPDQAGDGQARGDEGDQVGDPAAVAPLVVVPGDDLDHVAAEDHGRVGVDDRGAAVALEVDRHERLVRDAEDALERAGGRRAERVVELLDARVARSTVAVKSTTLTVGVGTRRLKPSNLPLRSGMTRARALAAPVVVGMMFWPALRARRGSLWATSRMRWSFV